MNDELRRLIREAADLVAELPVERPCLENVDEVIACLFHVEEHRLGGDAIVERASALAMEIDSERLRLETMSN